MEAPFLALLSHSALRPAAHTAWTRRHCPRPASHGVPLARSAIACACASSAMTCPRRPSRCRGVDGGGGDTKGRALGSHPGLLVRWRRRPISSAWRTSRSSNRVGPSGRNGHGLEPRALVRTFAETAGSSTGHACTSSLDNTGRGILFWGKFQNGDVKSSLLRNPPAGRPDLERRKTSPTTFNPRFGVPVSTAVS